MTASALPPFDHSVELPFGRIPGLTDADRQRKLLERLSGYGITDAAQLFGLLSIESLRPISADSLQLTMGELLGLMMTCRMAAGPAVVSAMQASTRSWPIGMSHNPERTAEAIRLAEASLPPKPGQKGLPRLANLSYGLQPERGDNLLSWAKHLPAVRDQGERATGPAFALTAANELLRKQLGKEAELSEQFLFYEAKLLDADSEPSTSLGSCATVLLRVGQCRRSSWAYSGVAPTLDHGQKPLNARSEAGNFRTRPQALDPTAVEIRNALDSGHLVPLVVPVYSSWLHSLEVQRSGRLTLPLATETHIGYHAFTAVGYDDEVRAVIVRNSWGSVWGRHSAYGPGYGALPYQMLPLIAEAIYVLPGT